MATFTGTNANETIIPGFVSATVTRNPAGSVPSAADDTLKGAGGNDTLDGSGGNYVFCKGTAKYGMRG